MKRKNLLLTLAMIPSMLFGIASVTSCGVNTKYNAQNVITRRASSLSNGNISNNLEGVELTTFKESGSTIILNLGSLQQWLNRGQTLSLNISELKEAYNLFTSDDGILILKLDLPESFGSLSLETSINPNITTNLYAYKAITASTYYLALDINNMYIQDFEYFDLLFTNEIDAKYASSFVITPMQNPNLTYTAFDNFSESDLTVENVLPVGEVAKLSTVFTEHDRYSDSVCFDTSKIVKPVSDNGFVLLKVSYIDFNQYTPKVIDGGDNCKILLADNESISGYWDMLLAYKPNSGKIRIDLGADPADVNTGAEMFFENDNLTDNNYVKVVRASNWTYSDMIKDGGTKTIVIDVDSRYTEEQIIEQVKAVDLFGVDVPITKVSSDYVIGQTGTFNIVISATDSYGQTAQATLICDVRDYAVPVITQKVSDIHYDYGTLLTEAKLLENFELSDNMGTEGLTTKFVYPTGFDISNALVFGKYALTLEVTDAFNNKTTKAFTLNVVDNVAPVISKKSGQIGDKIKISYSSINKNTINTILGYYSANDAIDGACDVYIKEGKIPSEMAGDFTLKIAAKDKSDNEAVYTVNCEIVADLPPVFILSDKLVNATISNPLDLTDLQNIVQKAILKKTVNNLQINASGYLANSDKVGSYPVSYTYYDDNMEVQSGGFTLQVTEDLSAPKEDNYFVNAFKTVFKHVTEATATQWIVVIATFLIPVLLIGFIANYVMKCIDKAKKEEEMKKAKRKFNSKNYKCKW
jgi:hypothetical protein